MKKIIVVLIASVAMVVLIQQCKINKKTSFKYMFPIHKKQH